MKAVQTMIEKAVGIKRGSGDVKQKETGNEKRKAIKIGTEIIIEIETRRTIKKGADSANIIMAMMMFARIMVVKELEEIDIDHVHDQKKDTEKGPSQGHLHLRKASAQVALTWLLLLQCLLLLQSQKAIFGFMSKALPNGATTVDSLLNMGADLLDLFIFNRNLLSFGQLQGAQPLTGMFSSILPLVPPQIGSLPIMQTPAVTQQATRHARRVYVGGLPPLANEQTIAAFFSKVMHTIGGNSVGQGDAVVNVYINHEKKFAFVEMRSVEEASNAMALDGIIFEGVAVRVRRPTDYNPSLAATLGPSQPSPFLDLAAVGLSPGATGGAEGPDRIFVGGLPYYFSDAQIRELLESFGPLRGFNLVKDRDTGNSKGYGFCVYQDPSVTDVACAALNGLKMGDKTLTVRRASTSFEQMKPEQELILQQAQHHIAMQKLALQAGGGSPLSGVGLMANGLSSPPTKVLCLTEVVSIDELKDDDEYQEILDDMRQESGKFGPLINVIIPRPSLTGEVTPGVGKVFLEFADFNASERAKTALNGRKFGGNVVVAAYYPEDKFNAGDYGVIPVI